MGMDLVTFLALLEAYVRRYSPTVEVEPPRKAIRLFLGEGLQRRSFDVITFVVYGETDGAAYYPLRDTRKAAADIGMAEVDATALIVTGDHSRYRSGYDPDLRAKLLQALGKSPEAGEDNNG